MLASLISFTPYKGPTAEVLLVILYTLKYISLSIPQKPLVLAV